MKIITESLRFICRIPFILLVCVAYLIMAIILSLLYLFICLLEFGFKDDNDKLNFKGMITDFFKESYGNISYCVKGD